MKTRDIINRNLVNLTNCDQEPIHIPGSIQQFGFLLGIKMTDFTIDFCSENVFAYTGIEFEKLLGKNAEMIFGKAQTIGLKAYIFSTGRVSSAPFKIELDGKVFTCTVELNNSIYILEFEPAAGENIAIDDIYQQTEQFTNYMQKAATLQSLCQLVAIQTRAIIGFDRVMIYKFDEDYNGEVFAESKTAEVDSFFGLHYPHTDIPAQARGLFIKNFIRLIADVNYTPVPIYTIDDTLNKNLDLSLSALRSVSPIHIQYLKNMGVGATLTISLMHENRLWGLIACHHYSPRYIDIGTRIAAKLQGHFLSSQISIRQLAEEYEISKKVSQSLDELLSHVFSSDSITFPRLVEQPKLLTLTNATGAIMMVDDNIYSQGKVPPLDKTRSLINWLFRNSSTTGFNTSHLSKLYADANNWFGAAAGIIFHGLGPGNCIIWCRSEALEEVHWAGNPDKAVLKDEKGLTPRQSFELWKEIKKSESNHWQRPELAAAASFANALQQQLNVLLQKQHLYKKIQAEELIAANKELFIQKEEKEKRATELFNTNKELALQNDEKQKRGDELLIANKELEQLTYIASHDLQEPLRTISNYMQIFEEDYSDQFDENAIKYIHSINNATKRMGILVKGFLDFSRLGRERTLSYIDTKKIIGNVIANLQVMIDESHAIIDVSEMPQLNIYETEFTQLFQNLISNAIKFQKPGIAPVISIRSIKENENWHFAVSDNGIGIAPVHFERVFDIFQRLHLVDDYEGNGIGLANCKKIVELHHGRIWINSIVGKGTTFNFTIPPLS